MIQWFPGHMAKAKRQIEENLKLVDIVFELIDARIPLSSRNPLINEILKNKPRLLIITKVKMADERQTSKWEEYFSKQNINTIVIDSISGYNTNKILAATKNVLKDKMEKNLARGLKPRAIRAMVIGIPNVGKSTLINKLVNRKTTEVGDRPGVTKAQQWIRINKDLELLDTPGVLWPKFDDQNVGYRLSITGAIKDEVVHKDDLIFYLLDFLKEYYPIELEERYNIKKELSNLDILNEIANFKGFIRKNEVDYEKVYETILNDFRNIRIGRITLDRI